MKVLLVLLGLLAALLGGAVALFTLGEAAAAAVVLLALALIVVGFITPSSVAALVAVLALVFVGSLGYGGYSAFQLYQGLTSTSGEADPPDPAALASANEKLDAVEDKAGFRVELTAEELTAVVQDGLSGDDNPLRRIDLTVVDGEGDDNGHLAFEAVFKNGSLTASGAATGRIENGGLEVEVLEVDFGTLSVPGIARGAVEDLVEQVTDLNETLAENQVDLQLLDVGQGRVLLIGTQGGGEVLTSASLLGTIRSNAETLASAVSTPAEQLGPGTVDATEADGARYYVALGDSLAANVGVPRPAEGYVSRFLAQVGARDGAEYGLRNFGISGETSGTLIRGGQLDAALDFMRDYDVAYVTIDIGANDLLAHIGSDDCGDDLETPGCRQRLETTLAAYRPNLDRIFRDVRDAAPDATVVFLTTYNPFSLGFGGSVGLETQSDDITEQLNDVAREVAAEHGVLVADGFAPMRGRAAATTHMLDAEPDIHPNSAGYDLLAVALLDALP